MSFPKQIDDIKVPSIDEIEVSQPKQTAQATVQAAAAVATAAQAVSNNGVYVSSVVVWILAFVILLLLLAIAYLATGQKDKTSELNAALAAAQQPPQPSQSQQPSSSSQSQQPSPPQLAKPSQEELQKYAAYAVAPQPDNITTELPTEEPEFRVIERLKDDVVVDTYMTRDDIFKDASIDILEVIKCCDGETKEYGGYVYRYKA